MLEQMMPFLLFIAGLIMIIKGSDWFVDSAVWIAKVLKIPDIIIGATLVSLCTTLPEAMVSTSSALRGNTDMAFGNALGSIILIQTVFSYYYFSTPPSRTKISTNRTFLILLLFFLFFVGLLFHKYHKNWILLLGILVFYYI